MIPWQSALVRVTKGQGGQRDDLDAAVQASARRRVGAPERHHGTGYFPPEVKKQLRILAAEEDKTIQQLLGGQSEYALC